MNEKPVYRCHFIGMAGNVGEQVALIKRLEEHQQLGDPSPNKMTRTSRVIRHDHSTGTIETLNSVYIYKLN